MSEPQIYTAEEEVERARSAQQILDNEIFKEACQRIDESLAGQRQRVPMNATESHTRLILLEQLWTQLRDYIEQVAVSGTFAKAELEARASRQKTLLERIMAGNIRI